MEIIINKIDNKKESLDESFSIVNSYKKIFKNYNAKIWKRSTKLKLFLLFDLIYLAFITVLLIFKPASTYYVCLGIAFMAFVLVLASYIKYNKYLNFIASRETNSIFKINEEKIELDNKVLNVNYKANWEDIKFILFTDKNIAFFPVLEKVKGSYVIIIPRMYEKEVKEAIEKCSKSNLIVYNKNK